MKYNPFIHYDIKTDNVKISDNDIVEIFNRVNIENESIETIAKEYHRKPCTIENIAKGRMNYTEKHEELGLKYENKINILTGDQVREIYIGLLNNTDVNTLAKQYKVSSYTIKDIRKKEGHFKQYVSDLPTIDTRQKRFDRETAKHIHDLAVSGKYTIDQLCDVFRTTPAMINDIKFCEDAYSFLKTEMGVTPPDRQIKHYDDETALKIHEMASNGMTSKEIQAETGICVTTIESIKFCRGVYNFLIDKYGKEPVPRQRRHH